ncbi:MAG: IS66 family insertion sequence element accessory protein TnpB [Myxococcales bacterium]|nr:IS66 family insertion sequence element accessory protein TnpB [Myxococcales bacterium]
MLTLPASVRLFVATEAVDMRKGIDGLKLLASNVVREDPLSGHIFVFANRRGNVMKALWWDRTGFVVLMKRLERGTFRLPRVEPPGDARRSTAGAAPAARGLRPRPRQAGEAVVPESTNRLRNETARDLRGTCPPRHRHQPSGRPRRSRWMFGTTSAPCSTAATWTTPVTSSWVRCPRSRCVTRSSSSC